MSDSQFFKTRAQTKDWLDKMMIKDYFINDDLTVDVNDDVYLHGLSLTELPVQFGHVDGVFNCSENLLKSLKGSPHTTKNSFRCTENKIESLKFCPFEIGRHFYCDNNLLRSLEGSPQIIRGTFNCSFNQLSDLKFGPKKVLGSFDCLYNQISTLKYLPESAIDFNLVQKEIIDELQGQFHNGTNTAIRMELDDFKTRLQAIRQKREFAENLNNQLVSKNYTHKAKI